MIEPSDGRDLAATAALLHAEHPDVARFEDETFLTWLYRQNPCGRAIEENVDRQGRRVAHFALVPQRWRSDEGIAGLVLSVNAVTRSGLGSMHFVALTARATRRAYDERSELGGLVGGIGVTNDASTLPGLHRIGAQFVQSLPVVATAGSRRRPRGMETYRVDEAFLESKEFEEIVEGVDRVSARGWTQCWTKEQLRWRLAAPGSEYGVHVDDALVAVSTSATVKGARVAVLLKLLVRGEPAGASAARHARAARAFHRASAVVYAGFNRHVTVSGIRVPKILQPAPLNLLFLAKKDASALLRFEMGDDIPEVVPRFDTFELLDFDAL